MSLCQACSIVLYLHFLIYSLQPGKVHGIIMYVLQERWEQKTDRFTCPGSHGKEVAELRFKLWPSDPALLSTMLKKPLLAHTSVSTATKAT